MGFAENYMEKVYKDSNKRLKYFEQYKKEILAATDLNNELRNKLMLVPKTYWDDFTKYLLNDPEYRNALNAANPDKEEKSNKKSTKKEKEEFDFSEWEDDEDNESTSTFNWDDDDNDESSSSFNWDEDDDESSSTFNWDEDDEEDVNTSNKTNSKFENIKKEILNSSDFNQALRNALSNMPKEDWDAFKAYIFKDPNYREALAKANSDNKEKTQNQRKSNKSENIFDFTDDDDKESDSADWEETDDNVITDEKIQKVNGMKNALYSHFDNETYNDINAEQLIDTVTELLVQEQINKIEEALDDFLIKGKPGKNLESLQSALKYRHAYIVISTTCENIGKILNNYKINKLNRKINNHYDMLFNENGKLIEATISKIKTKQNLQKTGLFLGKVLLAPLKATAKIIEMSDEYAQRPEVQERRRQESIRYYCKFCGKEFKDPKSAAYNPCFVKARYDKALANLEGGVPPSHHYCQLYEGTQKSEYRCKRCGKTEKTIASLVLSGPCHPIHIVNIDKYNTHGGTSDTAAISLHEPAL